MARLEYPADKARQAEIVLRKPWQRIVFFSALFGGLLLLILMLFLMR